MVSQSIPRLEAGIAVSGHAFREDVPSGHAKCEMPVSSPYSGVREV